MQNDFARSSVTVSELLRSVRDTLERRFPLLWVRGEVSNLRPAASGHCYFTLKDRGAQVDCVMFRSRATAFEAELKEGMQVEAHVLVSLYEPRGRFQLTVEALRPAGLGPLYERFLKLKEKLEREGLFDASLKRPLPEHPRTIGVVTSLAAAALRDVLTTLARRNPAIPVIVYPAPVQGEGAGYRIAAALKTASGRAECDVLLLVRGGGSIEDLWSFNEESVARAIRASRIPVLVGVGHESDFTIADFAADQRAPTPTAAAELATPARAELAARVADCVRSLSREMRRLLQYAMQALDGCAKRLVHPAQRLRAGEQTLTQLRTRLAFSLGHRVHRCLAELSRLQASLAGMDPTAVLERGYSITRTPDGKVLRDAARIAEGDEIFTTLARGSVRSKVKKRELL
ncbi:MAG: exodeoxyribonuclease VII large subunit [Betaproteobacteria bacterium]|nr:exodeoxyribonuclease VII large subunit [Betaproteobacteria bacterium]MBV9361405.1 exodeoxyribonuclease VII large subunit [Betaproteobacteria bacterium]